jgi:hypothetical protein
MPSIFFAFSENLPCTQFFAEKRFLKAVKDKGRRGYSFSPQKYVEMGVFQR